MEPDGPRLNYPWNGPGVAFPHWRIRPGWPYEMRKTIMATLKQIRDAILRYMVGIESANHPDTITLADGEVESFIASGWDETAKGKAMIDEHRKALVEHRNRANGGMMKPDDFTGLAMQRARLVDMAKQIQALGLLGARDTRKKLETWATDGWGLIYGDESKYKIVDARLLEGWKQDGHDLYRDLQALEQSESANMATAPVAVAAPMSTGEWSGISFTVKELASVVDCEPEYAAVEKHISAENLDKRGRQTIFVRYDTINSAWLQALQALEGKKKAKH
jgi:hypothetical protein